MPRFILILLASLLTVSAFGQNPPRLPKLPSKGYVVDDAHLLTQATVSNINATSGEVHRTLRCPIVVVTIPSLASMNASGWTIEGYASHLFDTWAIGYRAVNKGILLLISRDDRKARIELGADWMHSKDNECRAIMDQDIVPRFKQGDFDGGTWAGVRSLASLARGGYVAPKSYTEPQPASSGGSGGDRHTIPFVLSAVGMVILRLLGMGGRGRYFDDSGYGSGGFFSGGGSSGGGGGFSGGGSSGGGGASGSW